MRQCPVAKKPCRASKNFDALVVVTEGGMAWWLMNRMWRQLHKLGESA